MNIQVTERRPGVFVIALEGDVDMSTSPEVRKTLLSVFKKGASHIIMDLAGVQYIDSSGIATFVEGLQLSRKGETRFTLAGAGPTVESILDLAYLKSVFEIVPDVNGVLEGE